MARRFPRSQGIFKMIGCLAIPTAPSEGASTRLMAAARPRTWYPWIQSER